MEPTEAITHKRLTPTTIGVWWTPVETTSPREKYVPPITGHRPVIGWEASGGTVSTPEQSAKVSPSAYVSKRVKAHSLRTRTKPLAKL